jgi:hypothetical protein
MMKTTAQGQKIVIMMLLAAALLAVIITAPASADTIPFEVSATSTAVMLGQGLQLQLKFQGSQDIPSPELPDISGFQTRYIGPSTVMSIVNGRISSSITHNYRLIPTKTGTFTIGPFSFTYKGDTYTSNSLQVAVVDSRASMQGKEDSRKQVETELRDRIFVTMETEKQEAYLNEILPLTIKLYINGLSVRDIVYPVFEHTGFSVGDFEKPRQYKEKRGNRFFDVVEFKTSFFATRSGILLIGPAQLRCNLISKKQGRHPSSFFDGFFGRDSLFGYEATPMEMTSEAIQIDISGFPENDRPKDFKGAVGRFDLNIIASPVEVLTGDPVTLEMTVIGNGNFDTVTPPVLEDHESFKVYDPQVTQDDKKKVYEQVVIPKDASLEKIPDVLFSFFDPYEKKYRTIRKSGPGLTVHEPEEKEQIKILEASQTTEEPLLEEDIGRDIIYIKETPGRLRTEGSYLYKSPLFLSLQVLPVLLLLSVWMIQKKRERLNTDIGYARRLKAPRKARKGLDEASRHLKNNNVEAFYGAVFRILREYIGDRFHLTSGGITIEIVDTNLKKLGLPEEILTDIKDIFSECDIARYAHSGFGSSKMQATLKRLKEVIQTLEKAKL